MPHHYVVSGANTSCPRARRVIYLPREQQIKSFGELARVENHVCERQTIASDSMLRDYGFRVASSPLGPQVTSVGMVRITMITAYGNIEKLPSVDLVRI